MTKQEVAFCTTEINNANVEVGMNEDIEQPKKSEENDNHSRANKMLQQMKKNVENQNFEGKPCLLLLTYYNQQ